MSEPRDPPGLAHRVHRALLIGVVVSAGLMAVGLAVALVRGEPRNPPAAGSVHATLSHALEGDGFALIQIGLLVLILTPGVRVAVLTIGWAAAGDRRFAVVAGVVLGLLALSLCLGLT